MGFYIRKSLRVGPVRFNLSKSGIGVSSGIPGLRIGTGPRGTYIHMGRGGLYYRQTLSSPGRRRRATLPAESNDSRQGFGGSATIHQPNVTHGPMAALESGCHTQMVDSSSAALLGQIKQREQRLVIWPFVAGIAALSVVSSAAGSLPGWAVIAIMAVSALTTIAAYQIDQMRKSVVLMYDLDGPALTAFQELTSALERIGSCSAQWHINAKGDVLDSRYHAGAGSIISRTMTSMRYGEPPYIRVNVPIPSLPAGSRSLYFLPDHVLFSTSRGIGAIGYDNLRVSIGTARFIENGSVPRDARVVDRTWQYVNKNGTPDRRFKANRELPVCEYETLQLTSATGLNEHFQISRTGVSQQLTSAIVSMVDAIESARHAEAVRSERERDQVRQSLANTLAVAEAETVVDSPPKKLPSLHEALLDLLCCVMACDGRATTKEKQRIIGIMSKVGSPWSNPEVSRRIDAFVGRLHQYGHAAVFRSSLGMVALFTRAGKQGTLLKSIELVAKVDGEVDRREQEFCDRIRETLAESASLAT